MYQNIFARIDIFLNSITMYRLVLYALFVMAVVAIAFSYAGILPFDGTWLLASMFMFVVACMASNRIIALIIKVPVNVESDFITGLILFFIMTPATNARVLLALAMVGAISMATKYIFAWNKKHLFNPAAAGAVMAGFFGLGASAWWVALPALIPVSSVLGLLIVRKVRRFRMFFVFIGASLVSMTAFQALNGTLQSDWFTRIPTHAFTVWPLIFFGTIMLTEPLTMPQTKKTRFAYGALVGLFFGAPINFGYFYLTSELALLAGNVFSYFVSFKRRIILEFSGKKKLAPLIYEFLFSPNKPFLFLPGQYLELTLSHRHTDSRGNRRYFTIASAPTEKTVRIGIKVANNKGSSYKKALIGLDSGEKLIGGSLGGEFTLPSDPGIKLAFIAGGIGVTPFRSMVKYILDINEKRDIVLFYSCENQSEFVYQEIFSEAKNIGLKTVYIVSGANKPSTWNGYTGFINETILRKEASDLLERTFYLSGPPTMVSAYKKLLRSLGVSPLRIKTDYFFGY